MEKIIIGLVGEIASGKGTVVKYLTEKYGASNHRFSTMLRDILDRLHIKHSRETLQQASSMLRNTYGENILAKVMAGDTKEDKNKIVVIDGIRRVEDIEFLKKNPDFKLVFVDVSLEKRYERIVKREENSDDKNKTLKDFKFDAQREAELTIAGLREQADVILDNNGTLEELEKQIEELLK
ncbi:MAG: AAA family ATPase [Parcubacteria group bacterium]|jgi:dephospho-CoA kinase